MLCLEFQFPADFLHIKPRPQSSPNFNQELGNKKMHCHLTFCYRSTLPDYDNVFIFCTLTTVINMKTYSTVPPKHLTYVTCLNKFRNNDHNTR